jgi:hypothetical protein
MDLSQTRRKVKELEHYISLSSKLEDRAEDEVKPVIKNIKKSLELSLECYRESVSLEEEAESLYKIRERYGLEPEQIPQISESELYKSIRDTGIQHSIGIIKNTLLSIFSAPFFRGLSLIYADNVRMNYSTLQAVKRLKEFMKENNRIKQETLQIRQRLEIKNQGLIHKKHDLEIKEAEIVKRIMSMGYDEKTAETIVLNPDEYLCSAIGYFADRYGISE